MNRSLHEKDVNFGNRSGASGCADKLPQAALRLNELGVCNSLLDYGTGKGLLVDRLRRVLPDSIQVSGYDPAVEQWSMRPSKKSDIVTCLDVLEHIEYNSIEAVINDIHGLTKHLCYVVVDLQPAVKSLPDGRNAHILLAPSEWWIGRFSQHFPCVTSFPILHKRGIPQKVVIACCHTPLMVCVKFEFLHRLDITGLVLQGGPLGVLKKGGA